MASTAIDAALEALLALWRDAVEVSHPDVCVYDAEDNWESSKLSSILVGVKYDMDRQELVGNVDGKQWFPNLSTTTKGEELTIPHSILVWSGDQKVANRRAQAIALWQALEAAHRDLNNIGIDPTTHPGITVTSSQFGSDFALRYMHNATGNAALLTWDVTVTTRLNHH